MMYLKLGYRGSTGNIGIYTYIYMLLLFNSNDPMTSNNTSNSSNRNNMQGANDFG